MLKSIINMKSSNVFIKNNLVTIDSVNNEIWLTADQLADLFQVHSSLIEKGIKSIEKSGAFNRKTISKDLIYDNDNIDILYNQSIIIALSFTIRSNNSDLLRDYVIKKSITNDTMLFMDISNFSLN